jgi:hypothetical protein
MKQSSTRIFLQDATPAHPIFSPRRARPSWTTSSLFCLLRLFLSSLSPEWQVARCSPALEPSTGKHTRGSVGSRTAWQRNRKAEATTSRGAASAQAVGGGVGEHCWGAVGGMQASRCRRLHGATARRMQRHSFFIRSCPLNLPNLPFHPTLMSPSSTKAPSCCAAYHRPDEP